MKRAKVTQHLGGSAPVANKKRASARILVLDGAVIRDEHRNPVSIDEARKRWKSGALRDCNLAFARLAACDFDFAKLKAFYARGTSPE